MAAYTKRMEILQFLFRSDVVSHIYLSEENQVKYSVILQLEINLAQIHNSVDMHMQLNEKVFHT